MMPLPGQQRLYREQVQADVKSLQYRVEDFMLSIDGERKQREAALKALESQLQEIRVRMDAQQAELRREMAQQVGEGGSQISDHGSSFQAVQEEMRAERREELRMALEASHDALDEHISRVKVQLLADTETKCMQYFQHAIQAQVQQLIQEQASELQEFASCHIQTLRLVADRVQDVNLRVDQVWNAIGIPATATAPNSRSRRDSEMTQLPDESSPMRAEKQERQVTFTGAPEKQEEQNHVETTRVNQEATQSAEAKPDQICISKALRSIQQQGQTSEMRELSQAMLSGQPSKLNTLNLTVLATEMHKSLTDIMACSARVPQSQEGGDASNDRLRSSSPGTAYAGACHTQGVARSPRSFQASPRRRLQAPAQQYPAQSGNCAAQPGSYTAIPGSSTAPPRGCTPSPRASPVVVVPPGRTGVQSWQHFGHVNGQGSGFVSPTLPCGSAAPRSSMHLGAGCQAGVQVVRQQSSPQPPHRRQSMSSAGSFICQPPSSTVPIACSQSVPYQQMHVRRG
eukprot:TRINITY_DN10672_c0_g1_i1.p1 TRINITY_DN10672_c0_g1~~TRINITY_DN10672_c0_g1_i1.p1  ORF type:complete len:514 (+),score=81.08 TRINITY_DN10672_c0_g1_i1:54-1595(+)